MPTYDLIVIGAGIAGMTAAMGAANAGIKKILIIEKESAVGGIINQCIHNGFGEKFLGEPVTGPEYIDYIQKQLDKSQIDIMLNTTCYNNYLTYFVLIMIYYVIYLHRNQIAN